MDIIAFRLHPEHSVAVPRGSALFVRSGAVAWQTRRSDVLLDPNHALLSPVLTEPSVITGVQSPSSITLICEPRVDFGATTSARLIDSAVFLEQFCLTLTPSHARSLERFTGLIRTLRTCAAEKPESDSARSPSYGRVMQHYLTSTLARPMRLDDVAGAVGLSPHAASRIFHREAGLPLRIYARRLRVRTALARIADCQEFAQVALQLGFFDHAHFTKAFRAEFGMTPSDWRFRLSSYFEQDCTRRPKPQRLTIA